MNDKVGLPNVTLIYIALPPIILVSTLASVKSYRAVISHQPVAMHGTNNPATDVVWTACLAVICLAILLFTGYAMRVTRGAEGE